MLEFGDLPRIVSSVLSISGLVFLLLLWEIHKFVLLSHDPEPLLYSMASDSETVHMGRCCLHTRHIRKSRIQGS